MMEVKRQINALKFVQICMLISMYAFHGYKCISVSPDSYTFDISSLGYDEPDKNQVNITFTCTGDDPRATYYIQNKVVWSMFDHFGRETLLTSGFYLDESRSSRFYDGKYGINSAGNGPLRFELTIYGVTYSDDAVYQCTQYDVANNVVNAKNVTVTVFKEVERVQVEFIDPNNNIHAYSSDADEATGAIKVAPGLYNIKCTATGSNPKPYITLKHNLKENNLDMIEYISSIQSSKEFDNKTKGVRYTSVAVQLINLMTRSDMRNFTCEAYIPFGNNTAKKVSMRILVEKPSYRCKTIFDPAVVGYKILCYIRADYKLFCDGVKWIQWSLKYTVAEPRYDHGGDNLSLNATCREEDSGLHTSITVSNIWYETGYAKPSDNRREICYFIRYGYGPFASDFLYSNDSTTSTTSSGSVRLTVHLSALIKSLSLICIILCCI